jgi:hypothetical protein
MKLQQGHYLEKLTGIVERVTFHNSENGWSVLKVSPFSERHKLATVVIHQARVFAGVSMGFGVHGPITHDSANSSRPSRLSKKSPLPRPPWRSISAQA